MLRREPKLKVAWVSCTEDLSLVLRDGVVTAGSAFHLVLYSLCASYLLQNCVFLVRVYSLPRALFNPSFSPSLPLCFNFSWVMLTVLSLIAYPALVGAKMIGSAKGADQQLIPQVVNGNQYTLKHNWQNNWFLRFKSVWGKMLKGNTLQWRKLWSKEYK